MREEDILSINGTSFANVTLVSITFLIQVGEKQMSQVRKLAQDFALGLFTLLALSGFANANLLTNGSFELGNFTALQPQGDMSLGVGATNIEGWTVINAEIGWERTPNVWGLSASNGSFALDLTGYHNQSPYGGVTQSVSTIVDQKYHLTFTLGTNQSVSYFSGPIAVDVRVEDVTYEFNFAPTGVGAQWSTFSQDFTATTTNTDLSFIGKRGIFFIGLDDVSLTAVPQQPSPVPEPASIALLGLGLAGLGVSRRRKLQA